MAGSGLFPEVRQEHAGQYQGASFGPVSGHYLLKTLERLIKPSQYPEVSI